VSRVLCRSIAIADSCCGVCVAAPRLSLGRMCDGAVLRAIVGVLVFVRSTALRARVRYRRVAVGE
jgi:hypothetical protein